MPAGPADLLRALESTNNPAETIQSWQAEHGLRNASALPVLGLPCLLYTSPSPRDS